MSGRDSSICEMSPAISCPHCGHSFSSSRGVEKFDSLTIMSAPTPCAKQEDDMAIILEEVHRMDGLISQLNEDRAGLLRRINNTQSVTRCLPSEVLSTIFRFARPPIDFDTHPTPSEHPEDRCSERDTYKVEDDFQLVLGAVSSYWRQVAWATPQLWTTISVEVYQIAGENNVSLLDLYFENSRSFLMTVELDFRAQLALTLESVDPEELEESALLIESLTASFISNAAKIQNLIVTGLPIEWASLISKSFSRCQSMTLYWPSGYTGGQWYYKPSLLDLTEFPSLQHLCMKNLPIPFTLPWTTIATLELYGIPIDLCVKSLANCPNLIKFENIGSRLHASQNSSPSFNQPIVLGHLESLTWCGNGDSTWNSVLTCRMRFSKLHTLKWSVRSYGVGLSPPDFYDTFVIFFSNLPETLQVLELIDVHYEYQIMKTILTSIPHLPELILNDCVSITQSMAISMIGRPASGLIEERRRAVVDPNQLEGPIVLPCLRKLTILSRYFSPEPEMVVEMLEALGGWGMGEHFCFEETMADNVWRPGDLARLKRLAESGFEFDIVLGSQYLDYLSSLC